MRRLRQLIFGLLLCPTALANARPSPDVSNEWDLTCLTPYKNIVSAMDPRLIPEQMSDDFELRAHSDKKSDKKADKLYAKKKKAYLTGVPTVPWLTIYNFEQKPVYHALGYNSRSDELWQIVLDKDQPTEFAPKFADITPYSDIKPAHLPEADFTFVEYYAPWCLNCALMENAIEDFKHTHPKLKITHVRITADTRKMQKKRNTTRACKGASFAKTQSPAK